MNIEVSHCQYNSSVPFLSIVTFILRSPLTVWHES
ncbi:unnamed protein product, partial [Brugia timori]|uniref:Uncharacterized protein n=1 Tax=Brugia timori TaxID=42155 RepID=A0A0R3QBN3_9BILA